MAPLSAPVASTAPRYPIRVAARRLAMSPVTLRAWERRYGAIAPERTRGGQRLFSDADIERVRLLQALTERGTAISALAPLTTAELRRLAPDLVTAIGPPPSANAAKAPARSRDLTVCERAILAFDTNRLHQTLMRLVLERGPLSFLEEVASPLCAWIGDEWARGGLTEAHEHTASEIMRRILAFMLQTLQRERRGRHLVLATLAGERHEFGAMMAGIIAAYDGWSYHYVGADLPAAALGAAVKRIDAKLIAVSIVAPHAASQSARELLALRRATGRRAEIVVGGPAAAVVDDALVEARAIRVNSLREWREFLAERERSAR